MAESEFTMSPGDMSPEDYLKSMNFANKNKFTTPYDFNSGGFSNPSLSLSNGFSNAPQQNIGYTPPTDFGQMPLTLGNYDTNVNSNYRSAGATEADSYAARIDAINRETALATDMAGANTAYQNNMLKVQQDRLTLDNKMQPWKIGMGAIQTAGSLYGLYQGHKQLKLGEKNFKLNEKIGLANLENQKITLSDQYREREAIKARASGASVADAYTLADKNVANMNIRGA